MEQIDPLLKICSLNYIPNFITIFQKVICNSALQPVYYKKKHKCAMEKQQSTHII